MADIDEGTLNGLAEKLDALNLDQVESALLDTILERAAAYEPDVAGFAFSSTGAGYTGLRSGAGLSGTSLKLGGGLGFVTRPDLGYKMAHGDKPPPP